MMSRYHLGMSVSCSPPTHIFWKTQSLTPNFVCETTPEKYDGHGFCETPTLPLTCLKALSIGTSS